MRISSAWAASNGIASCSTACISGVASEAASISKISDVRCNIRPEAS